MTAHEVEAMKRNIEVQLVEYEQAITDYAAWVQAWRTRELYARPEREEA